MAYIWGLTDTVLETDHKPLIYIFNTKVLPPAVAMWLDVILDYCFTIVHVPGKLNILPDRLSRMYASAYTEVWGVGVVDVPEVSDSAVAVAAWSIIFSSASSLELEGEESAEADNDNVEISDETESNNSEIVDILAPNASAKLLVAMEKRGAIIPPLEERTEIILKQHLLGHFGRDAIYRALFQKKLWWPNMRSDIHEVVNDCDPCTRYTVTKAGFYPASFITANLPWDHVQIDTSVQFA